MLGGAQTPHNNTCAARHAHRGPRTNSGPPASPHPEDSARLEKRAAAGPATFDTGHGFPAARPGDAAGRGGTTAK
ncbi:hypothetical protein NDU88_007046 [Pleurodeles waltl]|uniref:Uncharacterized protein n=1 Tax=Pleurodeles waltl TaxID=8319 RepID=A0AAV7QJL8_PLEWA|nr:hypothetical protein NDU88_007046 [Pleurodeles waltl]